MTNKFPRVALFSLAAVCTMLSGCAELNQVKTYVKDGMLLPANEIAAPEGEMQLFHTPDAYYEAALVTATQAAVKALMTSLDSPVSLVAPITVHTLTSMNPEILSKNRFGSVAASHIGSALESEGYTLKGKPEGGTSTKHQTSIRGTYSQTGKSVTILLELTNSTEKSVLGTHQYTVRVDGALRKLLDS